MLLLVQAAAAPAQTDQHPYGAWEVFTGRNGLPDDRATCVCVTDDALWVGTAAGAARYANGAWTVYSTGQGLGDPLVTSIAYHEATGDVWIATLGGLTRYSAGRLIHYNQLNSGLINDVVCGVAATRRAVWVATSAGCGRYDLFSDEWTLFDQSNTSMPEVACNGVTATDERVVVSVFGGGVLVYELDHSLWHGHVDPDGERLMDLLADDGVIHDVVTAAVCDRTGRLWAGTPVGLSCFDGRTWRSFRTADSPLACDRINHLTARGRFVWIATDAGFCATDGDRWFVYRQASTGKGHDSPGASPRSSVRYIALPPTFPHEVINGIAFDGDDIWVATEGGLAHGTPGAPPEHAAIPATDPVPVPGPARLTAAQAIPLRHYSDPYSRFDERLAPFAGRRGAAPPGDASTVRIGFIGPLEATRDVEIGREMLDGIRLALDEANAAGGGRGKRYELAVRNDRGLWGSAANEVVSLARDDGVVAVLGSLGGAASLAAVQVAEHLELPVVNTAATDPGLTETGSAWIIRNMPDARQQAYALANHVYNKLGLTRVAGMRSDDRFGYEGLAAFREASDRLGRPLAISARWAPGQKTFDDALDRIAAHNVEGLVLWGPAADAAEIVKQVRARGLGLPIFGGDRLASETFLASAGPAAEGVTALASYDPTSPGERAAAFREAFSDKFGYRPGTFAAHAYDAARMLVEWIGRVGPDPARIRDEMAATAAYHGVCGEVRFDTTGNAVGGLHVARMSDGKLVYQAVDLAGMPANTAIQVLDRELARHPPAPREAGRHSRRDDFSIGCFWPLDARGQRVLRGAEQAVAQDEALHPAGPAVSLHAHDAHSDWGTQCAALVDLVREDEVLAIIGSTEPPGTQLLHALAARAHLPILALHQETPQAAEQAASWLFRVSPAGRPPEDFAQLYERTFGQAPDEAASIGYAAARTLIRAIRSGAQSRTAIRAALAESLGASDEHDGRAGARRSELPHGQGEEQP